MKLLKYCPKCGRETICFSEEKKFSCSACDFVLYHNCAAAVAVVIRYKDELLFTRRNQNPMLGKLDLAGGFTDPKESAEETCARELWEELKLKINPKKLNYLMSLPNTYHYKEVDYNTLDLFFEYEVEDKLEINQIEISEISETIWVKKSDINLEELAFESQKKFIRLYP